MKFYKKIKKTILVGMGIIVIVSLTGCGDKTVETQPDIKNVKVKAAEIGSIGIETEYSGKLRPSQEITITPKTPGKVSAVKVDVGATVSKGDVLFTLDTSEANAQLSQAKASLSGAKANANKTDSQLDEQIEQARLTAQNAKAQYDNLEKIYEDLANASDKSAANYDKLLQYAKAQADAAKSQYEAAENNYEMLKNRGKAQSMAVMNAQVDQAQAAVNLASIQVGNGTIVSPIDGVVSSRNIDEGEIASSASPAFSIIDTKTMFAEVYVPITMASKLQYGQSVVVKAGVSDEKTLDGTIDSISPNADAKTLLYTVRIKIDNSKGDIKPGMFSRVIFTLDKKDNAVYVPNKAIVVEDGVQYVYVVKGGVVRKTAVNVGVSNDKITEIISAVSKGDDVVLEGQSFLTDGEKVNIQN